MKKAFALSLVLIFILSLCACQDASAPSKEDLLRSKVEANVSTVVLVKYGSERSSVDISKIEPNGDDYTVYGKVTVIDNYGDRYVGKFTGTYKYTNGEFQRIDLNVDTPIRAK